MNSILEIGQLLEAVGAVDGRKKFQKLVHILQHFGVPFHFRFGYLHYGPYSSDLDDQLRVFETEGFIKEEPFQAGAFQGYRFTPHDSLKKLVGTLAANQPLPLSNLAKELNLKSAQELEAISTILYLESSGKNDADLKAAFCALKPKFAPFYDQRLNTARELKAKYQAA